MESLWNNKTKRELEEFCEEQKWGIISRGGSRKRVSGSDSNE